MQNHKKIADAHAIETRAIVSQQAVLLSHGVCTESLAEPPRWAAVMALSPMLLEVIRCCPSRSSECDETEGSRSPWRVRLHGFKILEAQNLQFAAAPLLLKRCLHVQLSNARFRPIR